jgi:RNA polymerase sigma-70 factor (ECF subfamily)
MLTLLEHDTAATLDLDLDLDLDPALDLELDIVPDEVSIDLAAALLAEAGRLESPSESPSVPAPNCLVHGHRYSVDELAQHRPALVRFARRKVRDEALAEDAVQDAMLAAVASLERFQGQSSLKTWLIGILNHKIQDVFRRETRYVSMSGDDDEPDSLDRISSSSGLGFDWADDSTDPMRAVANARMRAALEREIDVMPENLKTVFRMQALEGMATSEVCEKLSITEANCWVRLHRARKHLAARMRNHLD